MADTIVIETPVATVLEVSGLQGPQGPIGPQGPAGDVSGSIAWSNVTGKPSTFTPSAHTHVAADVTDFSSAVVAAAPPTTNASLLTSGTLPDARLSAAVTTSLGKADTASQPGHTHAIADVTGLQTALDGKQASGSYAAASHTHAASDVASGTLDNARVNWAAPSAIGSTTAAAATITDLKADTLTMPKSGQPTILANVASGNLSATGQISAATLTTESGGSVVVASGGSLVFNSGSTVSGQVVASNGTLTASAPVLDLSQTWNNAAVTFTGLRFNVTATAAASNSMFADIQAGGYSQFGIARISSTSNAVWLYNTNSGTNTNGVGANYERGFMRWSSNVLQVGTEKLGTGSARALEFQTDGTTRLTIGATGTSIFAGGIQTLSNSIVVAAGANFYWNGRSSFGSSSDGVIRITNNAETDFGRLQFGGTTSSFPALKRSSAILQARLADDSGYTVLDAQLRAQGTAPATSGATGTAGDIRYDADYIYVCTAANTWKRAAIATW